MLTKFHTLFSRIAWLLGAALIAGPTSANETTPASATPVVEEVRSDVLEDAPGDALQPDAEVADARALLDAYLENTQTLTAGFTSVLMDENRERMAESAGQVAIKRPGRFRWEYTAPEPSLLVTDGVSLWNFDPDLEQATVTRIADLDSANPAQLLGGGADLDRDFEIVGGYRTGEVEWVEVRPRAATSDFDSVRLGFSDTTLSMMELRDKLGQITQIALSDVVTNEAVADERFAFEAPEGTTVVDGS